MTDKEELMYAGLKMEKSAVGFGSKQPNNLPDGGQAKITEQQKIEKPELLKGSRQARTMKQGVSSLKKLLPLALILLFLLSLVLVIGKRFQAVKEPADEKAKFPPQKVIAQVGKETLYGQDLNYELSIYFPEVYKSDEPVPEEIKKKVLDQIIKDSLLLQSAADEGIIDLNEAVFNNLNKEYRARNILVNSIEEKANQKLVNWVKGELISIWFKNIYEPKMGLEAARQVTRAKMEGIYSRLKSGNLASLEQAAEEIKNDPALALIDPSYQGNARVAFEIEQGEEFFIDPKIQERVFKLPPGEVSEILVGQDQSPSGEFYDCCFMVIKIEEQKMKGYQSFEDWFNQKKGNYEVEIKI